MTGLALPSLSQAKLGFIFVFISEFHSGETRITLLFDHENSTERLLTFWA
jgi:hypothetical protein